MTQEQRNHEPAVLDRLRKEKRVLEEVIRSLRKELAGIEDKISSFGYDISQLDKLEQKYKRAFYGCMVLWISALIFPHVFNITFHSKNYEFIIFVYILLLLPAGFFAPKYGAVNKIRMHLSEKAECELCLSDMEEELVSIEKDIQEIEALLTPDC